MVQGCCPVAKARELSVKLHKASRGHNPGGSGAWGRSWIKILVGTLRKGSRALHGLAVVVACRRGAMVASLTSVVHKTLGLALSKECETRLDA